jgi:hypothetical protein
MVQKISSKITVVESSELERVIASELKDDEDKDLAKILNDESDDTENNSASM